MNLIKNKLGFANQSRHEKRITWFVLGIWFLMACYGWFLVEPTILRDSAFAQDVVALAIKCFPPLENFRKFGLPAEKALYLNSLCFFMMSPLGCLQAISSVPNYMKRQKFIFDTLALKKIQSIFWALLLFVLIYAMYTFVLSPNKLTGQLRGGAMIAFHFLTVPPFAAGLMTLLWMMFFLVCYFFWDLIYPVSWRRKNG
jgi:hypothetical protein